MVDSLPNSNETSRAIPFTPWIPYMIAGCLMLLGIGQAWRISNIHAQLLAAKETMRNWQWQVSEEAERQGLSDLRVLPLDAKDPGYGSSRLFVAWNSRLHQGKITVANLPAAPSGHDYQLWVLDPKEPTPVNAGVMAATDGTKDFAAHSVNTQDPGFAVSLEPAGGSPVPTGTILFAVAPVE